MPSRVSGGALTHVLALLCRVAAWLLVALTVCDAVLVGAPRSALLGVNGAVLRAFDVAVKAAVGVVVDGKVKLRQYAFNVAGGFDFFAA